MTPFSKTLRMGAAAALTLAVLTTGAQGQVATGGSFSFGGETRGAVQIRGKVICAGCTLDEVRKGQPDERGLYQLLHRQGQLVMKVTEVNDSRWSSLNSSSPLWVRAKDSVFQQLTAEENLMKEIEITGLLNNTRTLDIFAVTVHG
jgi:hypothetical protein